MKGSPSRKTRRRVLLSIWRQQQMLKQRPDFAPAPGSARNPDRDRRPKAGARSANWPSGL